MAGERVGEALQAGVDVLAAAFDEAVGEEGTTAELRARVAVREGGRACGMGRGDRAPTAAAGALRSRPGRLGGHEAA
jgi:hypothetical protein